jgi:hypothetical protein
VRVTALHPFPVRDAVADQGRRTGLAEVLAGHELDHPDTPVRTLFIPVDLEDVIIDTSFSAAMVVVGRPHRPSALLGSARGVVRWPRPCLTIRTARWSWCRS